VDLEELGRRYTDAWNTHDPAQVAAFHAPTSSLKVNDGEPAVGHEAIAAEAQGFLTAFPDLELFMDGIEGEGDRAVYRWTFTGTNTGPDGTGAAVRVSGYEEWTLDGDGKITRSLGHFDTEDYERQLAGG
jgi:steroid delta-isomerase-like uncharacterized protein